MDEIDLLREEVLRLQQEREVAERFSAAQTAISHDAIITLRDRDQIVSLNPQAEQLFGCKSDAAIGKKLSDVLHPDQERESIEREIERCLNNDPASNHDDAAEDGSLWSREVFRLKVGNDRIQPIQLAVVSVDGSENSQLVFRPIPEHKSAIDSLFDQEAETQELTQNSTEGIFGINAAGECSFANNACVELLGFQKSAELVGRPIHDVIHHSDRSGESVSLDDCQLYQAMLSGDGVHVDDEVFWKKDGTSIPVEYWSVPIRRSEQWVGAVVTFVDTTQQRHRELAQLRAHREMAQQVDASENELAQAKDRLDLALTRANVGLWDWDATTNEVYYSPTFRTQLGYPEDVPWNDFEAWRSHLHPDDVDGALQRVEKYFQREVSDYRSKFRFRCADGSYRWILAQGNADFDADGKPLRMIGVHVDITDQVNNEQELARLNHALLASNGALRDSNVELQQFASVASHDLQAPLRAITGFGQYLLDDYSGKFDATADDYINRIVRNSRRMQRLIDDLLHYSRADGQSVNAKSVDLNNVLSDALQLLESTIESAGAIVTHDRLPTVLGSENLLSQVLQNLIGNGLKYTQGSVPHVHVSAVLSLVDSPADPNQHEWTISVKDNGIGISDEYQEKVFEIFRRLHTQTAYPGSGIGLALCRRIVHRHGGRIWLESKLDHGSTFFFTLPQADQVDQ